MRGKLSLEMRLIIVSGITPAHAGKTTNSSRESSANKDHPRACGENAGKKKGKAKG